MINVRFFSLLPTTGLLICASFNLNAQVYNASENYSVVATPLGQGNSAIVSANTQAIADNACVPTSTANGLSYLYQQTPGSFTANPNSYGTVNTLIGNMGTTGGGTTTIGQMNGMQTYLNTVAPGVTISGQVAPTEINNLPGYWGTGSINAGINMQTVNPTAQFMANALSANSAVEIGILWGTLSGGVFTYTGGHEATLTSINLSGGSGTMNILDPWGNTTIGGHAGSSAVAQGLSVSTVSITGIAGTFLDITYQNLISGYPGETTPPAGNFDVPSTETTAFAGGTLTGIIIDDAVEAVPEPAMIGLVAIGLLGALTSRRQRK
jgi:hypothetical protein